MTHIEGRSLADEAAGVLDYVLFGDVHNRTDCAEPDFQVTYEGDNYVMRHFDTGELFHFRVTIEPHEWDSEQARRDQEWWDDE